MNIFNQVSSKMQNSVKIARGLLSEYVSLNADSKQITLGRKTVSLLCQQAISRVKQLKDLTSDPGEGLIATVEQKDTQIQLHFTPLTITLHEDTIEGKIRLLKAPQIQSDSFVYRSLIAGWQTFLGGYIPNQVLPEGVHRDGDIIYYTLPRHQLRLLETLFKNLEPGSSLTTILKQGNLIIESSVTLNWNKLDFQSLLQILKIKT
jgi:hypothetical protein